MQGLCLRHCCQHTENLRVHILREDMKIQNEFSAVKPVPPFNVKLVKQRITLLLKNTHVHLYFFAVFYKIFIFLLIFFVIMYK